MPLAKRTTLIVYATIAVLIAGGVGSHYWQRYALGQVGERQARLLAIPVHRLDLYDKSLPDALVELSCATGVPIEVDRRAIAAAGIDPNRPVDQAIFGLPLQTALEVILHSPDGRGELVWAWRGGTIHVCTVESLDEGTYLRVYEIADLLPLVESTSGPDRSRPQMVDELIRLVTMNVHPDAWFDNGGRSASLTMASGKLFVTDTPRGHQELSRFLDMIRQSGEKACREPAK